MELKKGRVYRLKDDFYSEDYDGNDNYGIMYHKGEYVFVCECGPGEGGYYALIANKNITINWGPAGTKQFIHLLEETNIDITKEEDLVKVLLILDGNMSIYDGEIRWNRRHTCA